VACTLARTKRDRPDSLQGLPGDSSFLSWPQDMHGELAFPTLARPKLQAATIGFAASPQMSGRTDPSRRLGVWASPVFGVFLLPPRSGSVRQALWLWCHCGPLRSGRLLPPCDAREPRPRLAGVPEGTRGGPPDLGRHHPPDGGSCRLGSIETEAAGFEPASPPHHPDDGWTVSGSCRRHHSAALAHLCFG
jgi:hypothetical protein